MNNSSKPNCAYKVNGCFPQLTLKSYVQICDTNFQILQFCDKRLEYFPFNLKCKPSLKNYLVAEQEINKSL